jgi:hypothetical protein
MLSAAVGGEFGLECLTIGPQDELVAGNGAAQGVGQLIGH